MSASHSAEVAALYRRFHARLLRALVRTFPHVTQQTLEDAAAFAWEQLCRKRPGFIHPDDPLGWLYVVARRDVLRILQREVREGLRDDVELDGEVDQRSVGDLVDVVALRLALASLKPQQRTALTGRAMGLRYLETAAATGRTYTWVDRHTREGLAAMREAVAA